MGIFGREPSEADLDLAENEKRVKEATGKSESIVEVVITAAPAPYVDPWDVEPLPPTPPADDADRPRWIRENVVYLEKLGRHRNWLALKASHPEIAERQAWARKNLAG